MATTSIWEARRRHAEDNYRPARRRAPRACDHCHDRKVRCDGSINGFPCTNCRLDESTCSVRPGLGKKIGGKQLFKARPRERIACASVGEAQAFDRLSSQKSSINSAFTNAPLPFSSYTFLKAPGLKQLGPVELSFLESQGCLQMPARHVTDSFVRNYFLYVHPCLPVIDEAAFWRQYQCSSTSQDERISLLVFQSMLFAASSFIPIDVAKQCGYDSLISARDELYRKSKLLYRSGVECDPLAIARSALLLTYYTSDTEIIANSRWLRIAIKNARSEGADRYYAPQVRGSRKQSDLKRVWWCCLIRDRIISLGMHRPIQITPSEFDVHQQGLTVEDLKDEVFYSEVYRPETKSALCQVLSSLCHFAVTVTKLLTIMYPAERGASMKAEGHDRVLAKLEEAKSSLLQWELDWMTPMNDKDCYLHSSLVLNTNLVALYYQSARIALCNHKCLMISDTNYPEAADQEQLGFCRTELVRAISSTAERVKQLLTNGVADKLPISAVAYTMLPQILLSVKTQLSRVPEDKQSHEVTLVFFMEVNRHYSFRYYTKRVLAVTSAALQLCQQSAMSNTDTDSSTMLSSDGFFDLFELRLAEYTRLLRYIDECFFMQDNPDEDKPLPITGIGASGDDMLPLPSLAEPDDSPEASTPAWMEAMEMSFFGSGTLDALPSSTPEGLVVLPFESPDSSQPERGGPGHDKSETSPEVLECLQLLGE
ncbi:hypothetical protein P170DRAFT_460931 [Aspergillus steynii IBT 23096]|uniref:Zn(2)-C6 fungal-type domain-containing protein n=1 Tax=Aspergillus steynii IBT 23096 TaxID=1392250 RepID=A0A2I2GQ02_9EURO|nr:uncharacterized protein P170DRAFT_460931 [Aspergillus steynii IBT 23096]PLB54958.1 hypothetical protein P170DRAFT_460931 [Aspergillus steynii IBT 23096]